MTRRRESWSSTPSPPVRVEADTVHPRAMPAPSWVVYSEPSRHIRVGDELLLLSGKEVIYIGCILSIIASQAGWTSFKTAGFCQKFAYSLTGYLCVPNIWVANPPPQRLPGLLSRWRPTPATVPSSYSSELANLLRTIGTYSQSNPEPAWTFRGPSLSLEGGDMDVLWERMQVFREASTITNERRGSV
ncbi:uncharacterized protein TRAVEDRAFT_50806 [Trametes versicolor FP-101664 SS1]|uniref:uncharacterized protein n=1 Tax=Trametes versicolor (strain FP-101664) TaxID=717944 RepID=UPI0004622571|nr:uncharacterized protein TRAVEDRAFT_50806 [Trametes versicolor FP-101664 SS1]EIW54668.1 hypothetical protein TRAVEDRAFT_50806 [Trametes versicolor FP-101664 SS1]